MTGRVRLLLAAMVSAAVVAALGTGAAAGSTGIRVASASWTSSSTGWVLGTTGCQEASCTTVAGTTDAGATWIALAAPDSPLAPSGGNGVDEVHRADATNGWAFYPQLFSTHNGATSWRRQAIPGGGTQVLALTSAAGYAFAVVSTCQIGNPSNCSGPASLWRTPVSADTWTRVPLALPAQGFPLLSASDAAVYVTGQTPTGSPYLASSTDGVTWSQRPVPCADPTISVLRVAAAGGTNALLLCSENVGLGRFSKVAYVTANAGRTSVRRGEGSTDGQPLGLAAQGRVGLVAVSGNDSHILRSPNAGRTFTQTYTGPSEELSDVQLVGSTGSVVSGPSYFPLAAGDLVLSHDGGLTWAVTSVTV